MEIGLKGKGRDWSRAVGSSARSARREIADWLGRPIRFASLLLVVVAAFLLILGREYDGWRDLWQGVFVEAAGAAMDLVVFGVVIALVAARRDRKREIDTQVELIDDFKKWNTDEARYRIAGAVRRLNRVGRTAIDFGGIEISDFSFRRHDIANIAGSTFYDGTWGSMGSRDTVALKKVDFTNVNCRDVVFSAFNPLGGLRLALKLKHRHATLRDCWFTGARLDGAKFKGALMAWSEEPPEEVGEWDTTTDGEHFFVRTYHGPFDMSDLSGASFEDVMFQNADFRGADNLRECQFSGASGLEECVFDREEDKEWAMRAAARTKSEQ